MENLGAERTSLASSSMIVSPYYAVRCGTPRHGTYHLQLLVYCDAICLGIFWKKISKRNERMHRLLLYRLAVA